MLITRNSNGCCTYTSRIFQCTNNIGSTTACRYTNNNVRTIQITLTKVNSSFYPSILCTFYGGKHGLLSSSNNPLYHFWWCTKGWRTFSCIQNSHSPACSGACIDEASTIF